MRQRLGLVLILLLTAGAFTAVAVQRSPADRPWPPGVQPVSPGSPALPPEEALKTFYMPPGYHLELVASEPLVQDPIAIDWDADGRLWVVEYPEYVRDLQAPEPNLDPIGRVVVLEDTNDDGVMDKRTVFVDGLVQGRSVKALDRGILVHEPPDIWLMQDIDGDLKMDTRTRVATGHGRREGSVEGNANGLLWGLDNWLHSAGSGVEFSLRLKDGTFDRMPTLSRGEWSVTQDDFGRVYRNSSESALHVDLVPTPYFARNPGQLRTRGSYEPLTSETGNINSVWPVRPNPGTNRSYQFGVLRSDGTLVQFTAACGPVVYRGDRLPAELYGNVFVAEPAGNFVSRIVIEDDGAALRGRKAYENAEFLASTDERFRPVFLANAPDGTITIVDFYRGILQDRSSTTMYLRDYIVKKELEAPIGLGRIYRVVHETTRREPTPQLAKASAADLVQALSHPNAWHRDTAQRLLVERGAGAVVDTLENLAVRAAEPRTRVKALWVLDGVDAIDVATVTRALEDSSRDVRVSAIRLAERWLGEPNHPIQAAVLKMLDDQDWAVRQQLAASLGALPPARRVDAMVSLLERYASDPVVADAAVSSLRDSELAVLERLIEPARAASAARETATTVLAANVLRRGEDAPAQRVLAWVADEARPAWQRSALMRAAEVAVGNGSLPGNVRRAPSISSTAANAPGAPCPTCPGGRGGPGGAYAFQDARGRGAGARAGGAGGPRLQLEREPAAFLALASRGGELGTRAAEVLEGLGWPGKPGLPAPVAPLTAEEQRRFEAGREVYRNICQACHQPDGRGLERVAPPLVGSALTLGPPEVTARILLNGKEGPVGLMPPLGLTLTDSHVADVLTYVRREWGHTASPVDSAVVAAVRAQTSARTRPWTTEELLALIR